MPHSIQRRHDLQRIFRLQSPVNILSGKHFAIGNPLILISRNRLIPDIRNPAHIPAAKNRIPVINPRIDHRNSRSLPLQFQIRMIMQSDNSRRIQRIHIHKRITLRKRRIRVRIDLQRPNLIQRNIQNPKHLIHRKKF